MDHCVSRQSKLLFPNMQVQFQLNLFAKALFLTRFELEGPIIIVSSKIDPNAPKS